MSEGTLLFSLLLALVGSVLCFSITRRLCRNRSAGHIPHPEQEGAEQNTTSTEENDEEDLEHIHAIYHRVFLRRILALSLCLAALAAWWLNVQGAVCLVLAGLGCLALYSAYRLRTRNALRLMQKRQAKLCPSDSPKPI